MAGDDPALRIDQERVGDPGHAQRALQGVLLVLEVGVDPSAVTVLGVLPAAHIPRSGFDVTSVVGWWGDPEPLVPVDLGEIAAVHQVSVASLLDPANRGTWVHPRGFSGPVFLLGDLYIWGFTAYLLDGMFDLLGWTLPWDETRTSEIPKRFLSERL